MAVEVARFPIIDKANKSDVVKECNSIEDTTTLRETIYQIVMQVIIGEAQAEVVVSALYDIIKHNQHVVVILCDVLSILDIESQILEKNYRDNFIAFLTLSNNRIVSDWLLKERLEYTTTGEAGIISNTKVASTKFIKLKTKLYYKQQKFNLFREESEGYSKLLTELCQNGPFDHVYMLNSIKALIGCFNLDPNRVLDIVLECFEARLYLKDSFIPLIKNFLDNSLTLNQILAFKFNFYNNPENDIDIPEALYDVNALVIYNNLIDVDSIYPFLLPLDSKCCEMHKLELEEAKNFSKKIAEIMSVEGAKHEDIDIYEDEKLKIIGSNQKLGLILSLLNIGDWPNAFNMINRLPEHFAISYPSIGRSLCNLLHYKIDPLYRSHSGLPIILASRIKPFNLKGISVEQVENLQQFESQIIPMIYILGPYIFRDTLLITKLIRICRSFVMHNSSLRFEVMSLLNASILPAFALVESNSALSEELWSLLKLFPYNERYLLYNNWKVEPTTPLLIKMKFYIMRRIRYIMKRISKDKDSVKQSGRLIGKLSHSNPTYLFEYILGQIQSYDNLIGPVVDSLKYLSSVSYDVLLFCVIEVLSNPIKENSKHEGTSISPWLISLANFCGSVVKKYPIELPGLLQFIANQLKIGKALDLLILKEIVQKMTGIETSEEMTDEQLEAMSGGELLKSEGGTFNQVRNIKKSTLRLKDALLENNLAMALCILMSQQRNCILFQSDNTHLKLIGKLYDQCQETLVQYGNFLSYSLTIDDYKRRLPLLKELLVDYNLSPDVTFFLARPMINHDINSIYEELLSNKAEKTKQISFDCYNKATDAVLNPLVESIVPALDSKYGIELSPRFFATFWTLNMYDLQVPKKSYMRETNKLNLQVQQLEDNKDIAPSKKKKERERFLSIVLKLDNEAKQQAEHTERVLHRLDHEKANWFESTVNKMDVTTNFLQHCLFPRCKFTASDALYCSKFVHLLHCLKTPNFSTLICFDRIFGDISYTMSSCTENEANHYGRFLCSILHISMRWHKDVKVFEEECAKFPGFVTKFCEKDPIHIDYESYRHVCHKWHYRLTKAFILCLDSGDYIQIRNSLIVLTKLLPFFPVMISFAQAIERRLENIRNDEKEKRPDLFVLATGYSGQLKLKKGTFIPEGEFHEKESKKTAALPQTETKSSEQNEDKREHKSSDHNETKNQAKSKTSKNHSRNSENTEVSEKKKEPKTEHISSSNTNNNISSKTKKSEEGQREKPVNNNKEVANVINNIRADSRASSVSSSPKRADHRIKEEMDDSKDYKKRKIESKAVDESDKRVKEESLQNRSYDKKSLRKRTGKELTQESPDVKRKKEDDKPSKRNEDRDSRKNDTKRTTSRRYKQEDDK